MSAINACWQTEPTNLKNTLNSMLQASDYWQPDKHSSWCSSANPVGLAKALLYNSARSRNDKVHYEKTTQLAITANARIDNREQLASQLALDQNDPIIATDAQLILQCYLKWGNSCVTYLRGDFVFIIWNEKEKKFFCARDHIGVKVLFYAKTNRGIMLSNEHKAFFSSGWCETRALNEPWFIKNLWGLGAQKFESPCKDIQILPPAHTLEISENNIELHQYWHLEAEDTWSQLSNEELILELKRRFENAVVSRLESEYVIGTELSEGLDSNGIAGMAAKHLKPAPLLTFSYSCVALNDQTSPIWSATYNDINSMLKVHDNLQAVWQEPVVDEDRYFQQQKQALFDAFGCVFAIRNVYFFYRARCAQSQGVRVLLSGWGGDHCVTSYGDNYADELLRKGKFIHLFRLLRDKHRRGRGGHPAKALLALLYKHCLAFTHFQQPTRKGSIEAALKQKAKQHFLTKYWRDRFTLDASLDNFLGNYSCFSVRHKEKLELFDLGLTNRLIESELLARLCRLEYRFPMLDVDLLTFAHSLPGHLKIYRGIERYPFRRVLEGLTTKSIQWRRKSEVVFPKIGLQEKWAKQSQCLAHKLSLSQLSKRYCSSHSLDNSLKHMDPLHLSRLEFLLDVEANNSTISKEASPIVECNTDR